MAEIKLEYHHRQLSTPIDDKHLLATINPKPLPALPNPFKSVQEALNQPIGSSSLHRLVEQKRPEKVVIVVNDVTRPTPYNVMLPPLLNTLHQAGITPEQITFIIATGIHRPNTDAENCQTFTEEIVRKYRFINHNPDRDLTSLGKLSDGHDLQINRHVAEADLLIMTGLINLHYFAGFSGGRKSILPGVAARHLITYNHSRMDEPGAESGNIAQNPVHHIMMEAARLARVDFILNVVTNSHKEIVAVVAGDVEKAWLAGVEVCRQMSVQQIDELADVAIAGVGGYPKDINMYQAQKGLEHAQCAVRPNGTVILVAACSEGLGEETFARWIEEANKLEDIVAHFHRQFELGGHKAYAIARVLQHKQVILVSELSRKQTEKLYFQYAASLEEALHMVQKRYGANYQAYLLPHAATVLPICQA